MGVYLNHSIRKEDYTFEWKQGVFPWYQSIAKQLGYGAITVEIDYYTYKGLLQLA